MGATVGKAAGVCRCRDPETEEHLPDDSEEGSEDGVLVTISRGRGMRGPGWFPGGDDTCSFYCTVGVPGSRRPLYATRQVKETLQPVWKEETMITRYTSGSPLEFAVWEVDGAGDIELLGKANLKAAIFAGQGFYGELQLEQGTDPLLEAFLTVKVRREGKHYPACAEEFCVSIENPEKKLLGIDFDLQDGTTLYITGIRAGLIQSYNERSDHGWRVVEGNFIVAVNGVAGECAKLLKRLKHDTQLKLVVRRRMEMDVAMGTCPKYDGGPDPTPTPRKGDRHRCGPCCQDGIGPKKPLGMQLKEPSGHALLVTKITDGLAEEWNQLNPDQAVRSGDRIVAFNGKPGRADELLKKMRAAVRFHMTIVRPSDLEVSPCSNVWIPPLPLH